LAIFAICAWSKYARRRGGGDDSTTGVGPPDPGFVDRILPARFRRRRLGEGEEGGRGPEGEGEGGEVYRRGRRRWRQGRGREHGRSNELSRAKPEMFDAWIEKGRAVDNTSKWETESVVSRRGLFSLLSVSEATDWLAYVDRYVVV
jgi:hypothetical protein